MKSINWREKVGKRQEKQEFSWRLGLHKEFVDFAEEANNLAALYHWNFWGGKVDNYSVTLSQAQVDGKSISIRILAEDNYSYFVSFARKTNPNNVDRCEYQERIGATMDDALKYLHNYLLENQYIPTFGGERICFMGGAYDRYPLALRWEKERIMEEMEIFI